MNSVKLINFKIYIALIILSIILIITGFYYSRVQVDDSLRINLAGRQRMLSQKIVKEILLYKIGEISPDKIINSLRVFSETQDALISGGPAPLDLELKVYRELPATEDKESSSKLLDVKKMWGPVEKHAGEFISKKDDESLKHIISESEIILSAIDVSVSAVQMKSEKNSFIIRVIIICSFVMISALLFISLIKRIKELRSAALRIKELETILPICSNCKKIRIDNEKPMESTSWSTIEEYLHYNKDMKFTHSICPDCTKKLYPDIFEKIKKI